MLYFPVLTSFADAKLLDFSTQSSIYTCKVMAEWCIYGIFNPLHMHMRLSHSVCVNVPGDEAILIPS